jgi:hypothetical protein
VHAAESDRYVDNPPSPMLPEPPVLMTTIED